MKQKAITISLIKKNNNIEDNAAEQRMHISYKILGISQTSIAASYVIGSRPLC